MSEESTPDIEQGESQSEIFAVSARSSARRSRAVEARPESPLIVTRRQVIKFWFGSWQVRVTGAVLILALAIGAGLAVTSDPLGVAASTWNKVYGALPWQSDAATPGADNDSGDDDDEAKRLAIEASQSLFATATGRLTDAVEQGRNTLAQTKDKVVDETLRTSLSEAIKTSDAILDSAPPDTEDVVAVGEATKERNDSAALVETLTVEVAESKTAWDVAQAKAAEEAAAQAKADADAKALEEALAKQKAAEEAVAKAKAEQEAAEEAKRKAEEDARRAQQQPTQQPTQPAQTQQPTQPQQTTQPQQPALAQASSSVKCSTASRVTFTATGGGTVTVNVTGAASNSASGNGSATVTLDVPSGGTVTALAKASTGVTINSSWLGVCS